MIGALLLASRRSDSPSLSSRSPLILERYDQVRLRYGTQSWEEKIMFWRVNQDVWVLMIITLTFWNSRIVTMSDQYWVSLIFAVTVGSRKEGQSKQITSHVQFFPNGNLTMDRVCQHQTLKLIRFWICCCQFRWSFCRLK